MQKISEFERQTGFELVIAAGESSDPYPGAVWRSGVLLGLAIASLILHFWAFEPRSLEVLLVGVCIGLAVFFMRVTKLSQHFVLPREAERETAEKAGEMFSHFQTGALGHQAAVLLFVSLNEHKMHLLLDRDLKEKMPDEDLHETLALLRLYFKKGDFQQGLEKAIDLLQQKILAKAGRNPAPPELSVPDRIFWFD